MWRRRRERKSTEKVRKRQKEIEKKKSLEKRKERERVHAPEIRDGFRIVGSATGMDGCI